MEKPGAVLALALLSALTITAVPSISVVRAQETLLWEGWVDSTGAPMTSPMLQSGWEYRIVANGVFIAVPGAVLADVQYYTDVNIPPYPTSCWIWGWSSPAPSGHSFLQIDGMDVYWGPFSNGEIDGSGHEYTIFYTGAGAPITFTIVDWIDGNSANNDCHIRVRIYERPLPPEAETAFAYGGDYATCFLSLGFRNWGWSNGPLGPGDYEFDIYAGAAKCNIKKGTLVGTLTIDYDGSTAIVTYLMNPGYMMQRTHLYIDGEILPRSDGKYTTSPGQYPYIHDPVINPASDTHTVTGLSGNIYVVAHADVVKA